MNYFAMYLFDETLSILGRNYGVEKFEQTPIFKNAPHILEEMKQITNALKKQDLYFHTPRGSLFNDYKIMRGKKFPIDRELNTWQNEHIHVGMSTEEAFEICKNEVKSWWILE